MSAICILQGGPASCIDGLNVRCQSWEGSKLALDLLVQLGRREGRRGHLHLAAREEGASGCRERSVAGDNGLTRAMATLDKSTRGGESWTEVGHAGVLFFSFICPCQKVFDPQSLPPPPGQP